eukprot:CAMPEP_0118885004 /NCGR_PEP_ID=MMETSP1163-20130328/23651_1 /TAXON_ID=124430 /ORGANISM="Phaeomonas parva, Strain CCMP2877" /LENGTH=126 /DNA_ID=CAMNT_0006822929 /DNA_START=74 /DNA_END=450 /DNA_ORIENTATION=+
MSGGAAFGAPKPLPGQRGFYARESDRLQAESEAMEDRLKMLQVQITAESQRDAKASGLRAQGDGKEHTGEQFGVRWRGGRTQRALRGYTQEMQRVNFVGASGVSSTAERRQRARERRMDRTDRGRR